MIDRRTLIDKALAECATLADAQTQIRFFLELAGESVTPPPPELLGLPVALPPPSPPAAVQVQERRHAEFKRRKWTPEEAQRAADWLDDGRTIEWVAAALGRTTGSVRHAIYDGHIRCRVYTKHTVRRVRIA